MGEISLDEPVLFCTICSDLVSTNDVFFVGGYPSCFECFCSAEQGNKTELQIKLERLRGKGRVKYSDAYIGLLQEKLAGIDSLGVHITENGERVLTDIQNGRKYNVILKILSEFSGDVEDFAELCKKIKGRLVTDGEHTEDSTVGSEVDCG